MGGPGSGRRPYGSPTKAQSAHAVRIAKNDAHARAMMRSWSRKTGTVHGPARKSIQAKYSRLYAKHSKLMAGGRKTAKARQAIIKKAGGLWKKLYS